MARSILEPQDDGEMIISESAMVFTTSYVIIVHVVLMNVVVAVLLDEFLTAVKREERETLELIANAERTAVN